MIQNFIQNTNHDKETYKNIKWKIPLNNLNATITEVENKIKSCVELPWAEKHIIRLSENISIEAGSHQYQNQRFDIITDERFSILQLPIRSYNHLIRKGEQGIRLKEAGYPYSHGWECHRWGDMLLAGQLEEEWMANSQKNGVLTRYDKSQLNLEFDDTIEKIYNDFITEKGKI